MTKAELIKLLNDIDTKINEIESCVDDALDEIRKVKRLMENSPSEESDIDNSEED